MSDERRPTPWLLILLGAICAAALVVATFLALVHRREQARDRALLEALSFELKAVVDKTRAMVDKGDPLPEAQKLLGEIDRRLMPQIEDFAHRLGESPDESRARVRALHAAYDKRAADEAELNRAVQIVQSRAVDHYDEALAALARIDSTSVLYGDAQAYKHWVVADVKVREANELKKKGDIEAARALLRSALATEDLGPGAKASVQRRLDQLDKE